MPSGDKVAKLGDHNRPKQRKGSSPAYQGKYPPEAFMIPGQDQNGNSHREWCRVVPLLDRAMDIILGTKKFPFKGKGDMMRWCIKTGVDRLEEMEPCVGSVMAQVDAMMMVLRDEELNHAFLTLFNTMAVTVGMHIQAQATGEARRVVSMMKGQVMKMEDGYWRDRYLHELEIKFGHMLKGSNVTGAGMGDHADGPDQIDDDEEER